MFAEKTRSVVFQAVGLGLESCFASLCVNCHRLGVILQCSVDVPACSGTAHDGLLQNRLEEDVGWIVPRVPSMAQSAEGLK